MKLHANARLSLIRRRELVADVLAGRPLALAAEAAGVSGRTAAKWVARYRAEGDAGLRDRSSARKTQASKVASDRVQVMLALRRIRFTGAEIAEVLGMPLSTVSGVLKREGLGKLSRLEPPPVRYERERPGELIHVDVKKLGRIQGGAGKRITGRKHYATRRTDGNGHRRNTVGWEFVHIAIDDATRLAYAEVLSDETGATAVGFLRRALKFFRRHGFTVERVLTDNGSPYISTLHAVACRALGVKHLRTRPRRPQTNGKAERFIRTMLAGWANGPIYATSAERTRALDGWLWHYNHRRKHTAIGRRTPAHQVNNLLGSYT